MRIETINAADGSTGAVDLPSRLNPVRVGHHPLNHVVLPDAAVGAEAFAIDNDVAGGQGWRLWNRGGRPLRVNATRLAERNQYLPLRDKRNTVLCGDFVLTVIFDGDELATDRDEVERLERAGAEVVRDVHRQLVELHPGDPLDTAEWRTDAYLHNLEREIIALVSARGDFPADDGATTALGWHLAGVAVRSALIHRLVAASADRRNSAPTEGAAWKRFCGAQPVLEAELGRLTVRAEAVLVADRASDLSARTAAVAARFPDHWSGQVARGTVSPRVARYLALRRLVKEVKDVWYGFGPLEDLLEDPSITEVMTLDRDRIFIEKDNRIEDSGRRFLTDPVVIAQRILAQANRHVNASQPMADARMPDGSRVNVVIPPLALSGPTITIRRFPARPLTADDLVGRLGALSPAARNFLRAAVENRRNIVVSGGTGTGKTTLLNCLSGFIPSKERIVTIEDTAELRIQARHVVSLQARPKGIEGTGDTSIRDLVRNALRMRPDRIVVGECRGGEAIDMLQAMNTGHDGSMTTLHANDPAAAVERLVVLVQQDADTELPVDTIQRQIVTAVDLFVQLGEQFRDGRRFKVVTEIVEVRAYDPEERRLELVPLFRRVADGPLEPTGHLPSFLPDLVARGLAPDPVAFLGL